VKKQLSDAVAAGRFEDVRRTLDLMTERFFGLDDIRPALAASDPETRRFAMEVAGRLAGSGGGDKLLAFVPFDRDARIEALVLATARERGALADDARIAAAIKAAEPASEEEHAADLWAEAHLHDALRGVAQRDKSDKTAGQARLDRALKQLRKAVRDATGHKQRAALSAIGTLGDRRAEREVLTATGSPDVGVFREAARAAILLDASGAVAGLVARLVTGPHAGTAARALALAGPRAVRELIHALPVTRGEGAIAPTAVADGRTVSGTVRAARALARIGESASREVLPMFGELGHRARTAVAHAYGARTARASGAERALIESAIDKLVGYGDMLLRWRPHAKTGLLRHELARRIDDTVGGIFDLAATLGERTAVQRAHFAAVENVGRDNALELVETLLPSPLGANAASFVASATDVAPAADLTGAPPMLDGWLEKCRKYDARELPLGDPMLGVLDKVLVLRDVPLFRELSGEQLYPVAEIASVELVDAGRSIVKQGDPSDDLYVVIEGSLDVLKDGTAVGKLGPGKTFGELGVLDGEPRAATVASETPCRLLRIPRVELEALLDESPEVARGIIRTLLSYVRDKQGAHPPARAK
ncbi:MAG: cyclic nucleotide-binding domain-containing protein, partial [Myxococcales bacterium]|nr:cyclic nucleotide-binding domain-containing protein [Myxococcales bacterium]